MSSAKFSISRKNLDIYYTPKQEEHTDTLIFMHGLGDTAEGWSDVFGEDLNPCPLSTKIVLLTAPIAPVTINNGYRMPSWYDIMNFGASYEELEKSISKEDVEKSKERIQKVLDEEVEILKGQSKRVLIGGFSQGCAMALHSGLGYKKSLGGIVGFSGYLFPFTKISKENENIPIFLSHGLADQVIDFRKADASYKRLDTSKHNIVRVTEKWMEHSINENILKEAAKFIAKVLKKV